VSVRVQLARKGDRELPSGHTKRTPAPKRNGNGYRDAAARVHLPAVSKTAMGARVNP
jgi:hypothetical protein